MYGFVTGASSGIGEAFAGRLAADGWDLCITARRGDRLRALAARLASEHGVRVQTHAADLTDPGDLAELERGIAAAGPDLLVNNAGFAGYREFGEADPAVVSGLLAVPAMVARGSGAIINLASLLAFSGFLPPQPLPYRAVYAGAKAFQLTFTQALAGELAGTGLDDPSLADAVSQAQQALLLTAVSSPLAGRYQKEQAT